MRRVTMGLMAAIMLLTGCGKKIDGSSDAAFHKSLDAIHGTLDADKRARFDAAVALIGMANLDLSSPDETEAKMLGAIDGLTADQVIAKAKAITDKRDAVEREQALGEIRELEAKKIAAGHDRAALALFKVMRSRFRMTDVGFLKMPLVELSVQNNSGKPVSRAYFHGVLASPGRSVPWKEDDFNYAIPGGIEPAETKDLALRPSFGWDNTGAPPDAIFTVTVQRLDGVDGKPIYDAAQFGPEDATRLAELKSRFAA